MTELEVLRRLADAVIKAQVDLGPTCPVCGTELDEDSGDDGPCDDDVACTGYELRKAMAAYRDERWHAPADPADRELAVKEEMLVVLRSMGWKSRMEYIAEILTEIARR